MDTVVQLAHGAVLLDDMLHQLLHFKKTPFITITAQTLPRGISLVRQSNVAVGLEVAVAGLSKGLDCSLEQILHDCIDSFT